MTAYIFIVLIAGNIPLDRVTLFASVLLIGYAIVFFTLFRAIITPSEVAKRVLHLRYNKKEERKRRKKEIRKEKIKMWKERIVAKANKINLLNRNE